MLKESRIEEYSDMILQQYRDSNKDELIFVCIGTDKCIGDCVAPLAGTFVNEENKNIKIYGTLENPVHALNIENRLIEIHNNHPNAFIIGIDACLGEEDDIGDIRIRDYAISPGKGVDKELPRVGDMSIIGIVDSSENSEFFFSRSIRLSFIWDIAKEIGDIVKYTYNKIDLSNNNVAITI